MKLSELREGVRFASEAMRNPNNPRLPIIWKVVKNNINTGYTELESIDTYTFNNVVLSEWGNSEMRNYFNTSFRNYISPLAIDKIEVQNVSYCYEYRQPSNINTVTDRFVVKDVARTLEFPQDRDAFFPIPTFTTTISCKYSNQVDIDINPVNNTYFERVTNGADNRITFEMFERENFNGFPGFGYPRNIKFNYTSKGTRNSIFIEETTTGVQVLNLNDCKPSDTIDFTMTDSIYNLIGQYYNETKSLKLSIVNNYGNVFTKVWEFPPYKLVKGTPTFVENNRYVGDISTADKLLTPVHLKYKPNLSNGVDLFKDKMSVRIKTYIRYSNGSEVEQADSLDVYGIGPDENLVTYTPKVNFLNINNVGQYSMIVRATVAPENSDAKLNMVTDYEVIFNKALPNIIISDYDLGGITLVAPQTFSAVIKDTTNDKASISTKFYIDNVLKRTTTQNVDNRYYYSMTVSDFAALSKGSHTLKIEAETGGITRTVTTTFLKGDPGVLFRTVAKDCMMNVLENNQYVVKNVRPEGIIIRCELDPRVTPTIKVTNNAKDSNPVWEDATKYINSGVYKFTNTNATVWSVSVEVSFPKLPNQQRAEAKSIGTMLIY